MSRLRLYFLGLFVFLLNSTNTSGQNSFYFDFNAGCIKAYKALMELRIEEGNKLLSIEKQNNPNNLTPYLLDNYQDFLLVFFSGDEQVYFQKRKNVDARLKKIQQGPKNDPWFRYSQSTIYSHWGILKGYFNNQLGAAGDFRSAYSLLRENQKLYPDFKPNLILGGMQEAMAGAIPENFQWVGRVLGIKGNVKKGAADLYRYLNQENISRDVLYYDAVLYYTYINYYLLSNKKETIDYLERNYPNTSSNHLFCYLKANMYNNNNQAGKALNVLNTRVKTNHYLNTPILDYEAGIAALRLIDKSTVTYFNNFLKELKGNTFRKSAYHKLSIYYLVIGNISLANSNKNKILDIGNALTSNDKLAQRYAEFKGALPNPTLMAAELLCDGGSYTKALNQIQKLNLSELNNDDEKASYFYRYGRIYQLMGKANECIPYYEKAIEIGKDLSGQFAARASVELGLIYEKKGDKKQAVSCYQNVLKMKNKDFRDLLQQKAKAGLNRLQ